MDSVKTILATQLTEREIMIYLLVEYGLSYRDLGEALGVSHGNIARTYSTAKSKIIWLGAKGMFETKIGPQL